MISRENFLIIIVCCLLSVVSCWLSVSIALAETAVFKNIGFPQKGIWYSKDPFFSNDKIKIYSAIYNSSQYELLGTVEFYDNDKGIGKVDFSVAGWGKIKDVWIDWQATAGNHKISAKIIEAKILKSGSTAETVVLGNNQTGVDERFIDVDADNDLIGNTIDDDDDNDGRTDEKEIQQGTDPLKKDSPPPASSEVKLLSGTSSAATSTIMVAAGKTVNFVINTAKTTTKTINKLADNQSKKIEAKKEEVKKEIEQIDNDNDDNKKESPKTEKPLKYAYLTALSLAGFILDKKILLYLILAFVLYKLLKFAYKKIFKKQKF